MSMFRPYLVNPASYLHRIHPFFWNDFSTKVALSGTQSTGQVMAKRPLDARPIPCILPRELTEGDHPIPVTNYAKQTRSSSTNHAQLSTPPLKKRKQMNLSRPASHRTCLRHTVTIMNGFNLKRYTNSPGRIKQYSLRGTCHRVRRHKIARETKLVKESCGFPHIPSWNTKTPLP